MSIFPSQLLRVPFAPGRTVTEAERLQDILKRKDDRLEELRRSLLISKQEAEKARAEATSKERQLEILVNEREGDRVKLADTVNLAKKLDSKLQTALQRMAAAKISQTIETDFRDLKEKYAIVSRKAEKQQEMVDKLQAEVAVLNRAVNLNCAELQVAPDLAIQTARMGEELKRVQTELAMVSRDTAENLKLREQITGLEDRLARETQRAAALERTANRTKEAESMYRDSEAQRLMLEAKARAAVEEMHKQSDSTIELRKAVGTQEFAVINAHQQLEIAHAALQEERDRVAFLRTKLEDLQRARAEADFRANEADKRSESERINNTRLEETIHSLENEIMSSRETISAWKKKAAVLADDLRVCQSQKTDLELQLSQMEDEVQRKKFDIKDKQRYLDSKDREIATYRQLLASETLAKARRIISTEANISSL